MKTKNNLISLMILMLIPAFMFGQGLSISSGAYFIENTGYTIVTGNTANSGTLNLQTGSFTLSGNYTNSGTYSQSTAYMTFNGINQVLTDNGTGTMFTNVFFTGSGGSSKTAVMSSGNFSVSSTGVLTMINATYLNANGNLTLNSDATGSASVAAIPSGASITGNVSAQRYITGGSGHRGYRLMSSPVYSGSDSYGNKIYSINYLINSTFLTGTDGVPGGFDKTGNPTVFFYREDLTPGTTSFTNSNYRGVRNIASAPNYTMDIDGGPYNIPAGNGYYFFFRGSRATVSPYVSTTAPVAATVTATNTLNQGTINVANWFTASSTNLSYTTASPASVRGYNLVGNPYACTINFEKFNRNGTNSSIYGSGFSTPATIYFYNPVSKQYCSYQQLTTISSAADTTTSVNPGVSSDGYATNMIASGQGFFIRTTATGQTFSFRETAKTTTQSPTASIAKLMGKPKATAPLPQPEPRFRLRLVKDSINTDEVVLLFNNHDTTAYSEAKDALDLGGSGALESLSLLSSDSVKMSIHHRIFPKKATQAVPLYVDATASGTYQLKKLQMNLPPVYELWLKDAMMKDSLDLTANDTYTFNVDKTNATSFGAQRFSLVVRENPGLAYHLLNFTATKVPDGGSRKVQLTWKTENESNYTSFIVERSTDGGKNFKELDSLQGSSKGSYSIYNTDPANGLNLYRLKQVDLNNTITYSNVISVQYNEKGNLTDNRISIYPNPASSVATISVLIDGGADASYTFRITNSSGMLYKQFVSKQSSWQANVADLAPGTYIVTILNGKSGSLVGNAKFIKL